MSRYTDLKGASAKAAPFSGLKWIPLTEQLPPADQLVLVKMKDDTVEAARWVGARSDWSRPPYAKWTEPVAWALLPAFGK